MDPNVALHNAQSAAEMYYAALERGDLAEQAEAGGALAESFSALDGWLSAAGFLPADWARGRDA